MFNSKISTVVVTLGLTLGTAPLYAPSVNATTFSQMVVFGDSLSDTDNSLTFTRGLLPNYPYYAPGRFSNGKVWTDYLAQNLGISNTINYAVGGARTDYSNVSFIPIGLQQQIGAFQYGQTLLGQSITLDSNALYTLWVGANDYLAPIVDISNSLAQKQLVDTTISNLSSALTTLANAGAGHIIVPNLPSLNLTPLAVGSSPENQANLTNIIDLHNQSLAQELQALGKSYTNTQFIGFDSYQFYEELFANPVASGLVNITQGCTKINLYDPISPFPAPNDLFEPGCSDDLSVQETFAWWDSAHPTTAVHQRIADSVESLLNESSPNPTQTSVPESTSPISLLGIAILGIIPLSRRFLSRVKQ